MSVPEDAEKKGNIEDTEEVFEEAAEYSSPTVCQYIEEGASCNILANIEKLIVCLQNPWHSASWLSSV